MTSTRLALIAAAGFLALGLTACGGGSGSVSIGSDGVSAQDGNGASVSVGADGATISDGNGNSVSAGADGATVSGADGSSVSAGADGSTSAGSVGGRQGTFGTKGQVTLAGAQSWAGSAAGSCDVNGDQRTVTAKGGDYSVVIDTNGADQVTLTVSSGGDSWTADFNGDGGSVVTLTSGRTLVQGAKLVGGNDTVDLDASFDC